VKLPFFGRKAEPKSKRGVRASELLPEWKFNANSAKWREWTTENAIRNGYKINSYVYACVNLIAQSASSIPWQVYQRKGQKTWEVVEGHPLELLMERPNPYTSRQEMVKIWIMHLLLGGNAITTKVRAGGLPAELWSLPPDAIRVIPDKMNFVDGYLYDQDGVKMKFNPPDIIHAKLPDPADPYWGISPLQAGAKIVDTDTEAQEWNKIAMENRAVTDGMFTFESPMTRQQWEDARTMIREQHQGSRNARTPWVLGAGAKWHTMSMTPAEMDFIESRKLTREEICSIFNVPPVMVGVYENATLANIETARKIFWQDNIVPMMEDLKATLNVRLTPDFGEDLMLDFDLSGVEALQDNLNEKITNAQALFSMGVPFNAINQRLELGFDDQEGGDISYLPTSVLPADGLTAPAEPEPNAFGGTSEPPDDEKNSKTAGRATKAVNMQSELHKEFYIKAHENRRGPWYMNLKRKANEIFSEEAEALVSELEKAGKDAESIQKAVNRAITSDRWEKFLATSWFTMTEEFGRETFGSLTKGHAPSETKMFGITAAIRNYIKRITGWKVAGIVKTTREKLAKTILDGYANDNTIDQIAGAVRNEFKEYSRYRSYRIARTEVAGASNYGSMMGAKQTGLKLKKEWLTSADDRVRDSHMDLNPKVVDMDEPFNNGLMFPADYDGKASEVIHCRCTLGYITD
jgi:HK97 family phage portal protein